MDVKSLGHFDKTLRDLVEAQYDLCLYKCTQTYRGNMGVCKNDCVTSTIVPFRFTNHAARDDEDNSYRRCLATKFPNIKQEDYIDCTHQIYQDRVKVLGDYFSNVSEKILADLH